MFSISIQSIDLSFLANLSDSKQYFDVQMNILYLEAGSGSVATVELQQCTQEHWSMVPEFASHFDGFGGSSWLCLPLGAELPIQGSYTSSVNYEVLIEVFPCANKTTCATQLEIRELFQTHGNFYLSLNYVNPVINPNSVNFMDYYLEGNDYIIFSDTVGSQAWVYFSDYSVITDNSIWPYLEGLYKNGCIVEQKAINHPYTVSSGVPYASVYLAKSENSLVYNR